MFYDGIDGRFICRFVFLIFGPGAAQLFADVFVGVSPFFAPFEELFYVADDAD